MSFLRPPLRSMAHLLREDPYASFSAVTSFKATRLASPNSIGVLQAGEEGIVDSGYHLHLSGAISTEVRRPRVS